MRTTTDDTLRKLVRLSHLLSKYGQAKLKDDWQPGNADAWIGTEEGQELAELLDFAADLEAAREQPAGPAYPDAEVNLSDTEEMFWFNRAYNALQEAGHIRAADEMHVELLNANTYDEMRAIIGRWMVVK